MSAGFCRALLRSSRNLQCSIVAGPTHCAGTAFKVPRSGIGVPFPFEPLIIPRLEVAPKLSDFLGTPCPGATQMFRVDRFVERFPEDGSIPATRRLLTWATRTSTFMQHSCAGTARRTWFERT